MNIEKELEISKDLESGPGREVELLWLAEQASKHRKIAEIGSWIGASARVLAGNTKGALLCVDTWDGGTDPYIIGRIAEKQKGWPYSKFLENTIGLDNITIAATDSLTAAQLCSNRGETFDMIFIDASHDFESVMADILAWHPLLIEGGLLCGHDYGHPENWTGVTRAVQQLFGNPQQAGSIWFI